MKPTLSIALVLSAALLSACGSSSSDDEQDPSGPTPNEESFEKFDLSVYEARAISAESLAGTWVYMNLTAYSFSHPSGAAGSQLSTAKSYFVVRETSAGGYEESGCESYFSPLTINGDEIKTHCEMVGTITDNQKIVGTVASEGIAFEMIKISDSVEPIGTVEYTIAGEGSVSKNVYSFFQESGATVMTSDDPSFISVNLKAGFENYEDGPFKVYQDSDESVTELTLRVANLDFYLGSEYFYKGAVGTDTASYSMDAESTYSNTITFNGSNDSQDVSGTIQIQLPVQ